MNAAANNKDVKHAEDQAKALVERFLLRNRLGHGYDNPDDIDEETEYDKDFIEKEGNVKKNNKKRKMKRKCIATVRYCS
jgi:hypothetical protein